MRRLVMALAALVTVGVLFIAVFPTRALLDQRRSRKETQTELAAILAHNGRLAEQTRRLETDAEVERLAREQYNLVRPGEEAYAILPSATPVAAPPAEPGLGDPGLGGPDPPAPALADPDPPAPALADPDPPAPAHRRPSGWWDRTWARVTSVF